MRQYLETNILVSTKALFYGPDGRKYKAVYGKLKQINLTGDYHEQDATKSDRHLVFEGISILLSNVVAVVDGLSHDDVSRLGQMVYKADKTGFKDFVSTAGDSALYDIKISEQRLKDMEYMASRLKNGMVIACPSKPVMQLLYSELIKLSNNKTDSQQFNLFVTGEEGRWVTELVNWATIDWIDKPTGWKGKREAKPFFPSTEPIDYETCARRLATGNDFYYHHTPSISFINININTIKEFLVKLVEPSEQCFVNKYTFDIESVLCHDLGAWCVNLKNFKNISWIDKIQKEIERDQQPEVTIDYDPLDYPEIARNLTLGNKLGLVYEPDEDTIQKQLLKLCLEEEETVEDDFKLVIIDSKLGTWSVELKNWNEFHWKVTADDLGFSINIGKEKQSINVGITEKDLAYHKSLVNTLISGKPAVVVFEPKEDILTGLLSEASADTVFQNAFQFYIQHIGEGRWAVKLLNWDVFTWKS